MAAVPYNTGGMSKATSTIKGEACRLFYGILKALRKPEQASLRVRESPEQASPKLHIFSSTREQGHDATFCEYARLEQRERERLLHHDPERVRDE